MEKERLIILVTHAQKGNKVAMDQLFTAFYNDVYYFALKTVKDSDTACDITQETFLEIIRTIGNLHEPAAFVTWMKQIAYHQCTRYFKKQQDVLVDEDEDGNTIFDTLADEREGSVPAEIYEKEEFRQTILAMVDDLTEEQRSAVMLYYFDELSVDEVAKIQGASTGTVKSRLNYARKALKKSVEGYEEKHGIKLHSLAPLPLLLWALRAGVQQMPKAAVEATRTTVLGGNAVAGAATAAGSSTAAGTTAGVFSSLGAKIIAGIVAGSLLLGGGVVLIQNRDPKPQMPPVYTTQEYTEPVWETEESFYYTESETVEVPTEAPVEDIPETTVSENYMYSRNPLLAIASTDMHAIALKADGTALYKTYFREEDLDRDNSPRYYEDIAAAVSTWTDLVAVDVGHNHAVGLKRDGTVVAAGFIFNGQCNVEDWTDIVAISAGNGFTVGIKQGYEFELTGETHRLGYLRNYRVCFTAMSGHAGLADNTVTLWRGSKSNLDEEVEQWENVIQVCNRGNLVAALISDGTVNVAQQEGNADTSAWTGVQHIASGNGHVIGLRADGTVVSSGDNTYGQCDVSHWTDIVAVYAAADHSIGLKADGTVVTAGNIDLSDWSGICVLSLEY